MASYFPDAFVHCCAIIQWSSRFHCPSSVHRFFYNRVLVSFPRRSKPNPSNFRAGCRCLMSCVVPDVCRVLCQTCVMCCDGRVSCVVPGAPFFSAEFQIKYKVLPRHALVILCPVRPGQARTRLLIRVTKGAGGGSPPLKNVKNVGPGSRLLHF